MARTIPQGKWYGWTRDRPPGHCIKCAFVDTIKVSLTTISVEHECEDYQTVYEGWKCSRCGTVYSRPATKKHTEPSDHKDFYGSNEQLWEIPDDG